MPHVNSTYVNSMQKIDYDPTVPITFIPNIGPFLDENNQASRRPNDIFDIEQDYIDLFSYRRKGHMTKYIHMYRPDIYDTVILQDSFYPFKMECDLLTQKADQIISSFPDVTEVVEIGPGAKVPIVSKTIPFLKSLQQHTCINTYKAMDINPMYAQQACQLVQEQFPSITTTAIEVDFLSKKPLRNVINDSQNERRKLLFGFGQPIFANNTDKDTQKFLDNIAMLLNKEDFFLFGIDTNRDEEMLKTAYDTNLFHELLLNTMYYLRDNLNLSNFNPEAFDLVYKWNFETNSVNLLLKPTCQQIIKLGNERLTIQPEQEFHISSSRKPTTKEVKKFLSKAKLGIKNIIPVDHQKENKFLMIVAQKSKN